MKLIRVLLLSISFCLLINFIVNKQLTADGCLEPSQVPFTVKKTIRRSIVGFTEGLIYRAGYLYESTGRYGNSAVNRIDIADGSVDLIKKVPSYYFAEGLDYWNGIFMLLTWRENSILSWQGNMKNPPHVQAYSREGWGLTHDQNHWITSDGSFNLYYLSPKDLQESKSLQVKSARTWVNGLNELEYVNGKIFANVFPSDQIVRINPKNGCVDGTLDLTQLYNSFTSDELKNIESDINSVPNGIAYNSRTKEFYIAGKDWPLIFQIQIES